MSECSPLLQDPKLHVGLTEAFRSLHRDDEGVDYVQGRPFADDVQVGGRRSTTFDRSRSGSSSVCQLGQRDGLGPGSRRADIRTWCFEIS